MEVIGIVLWDSSCPSLQAPIHPTSQVRGVMPDTDLSGNPWPNSKGQQCARALENLVIKEGHVVEKNVTWGFWVWYRFNEVVIFRGVSRCGPGQVWKLFKWG